MMLLNKFKDKVEDYLKLVVYGRSKISVNLSELILGLKIVDTFNLAYLESLIMLEVCRNLKDIPDDVKSSDSFKTLPFHLIIMIVTCWIAIRPPPCTLALHCSAQYELILP